MLSGRTTDSGARSTKRATRSWRCARRSTSCPRRRPPTACTSRLTTTTRSTSSRRDGRCAWGLNPTINVGSLRPGEELLLNEALNVVATVGYEIQGDVVVLEARLGDDRALVTLRADDQKIGIIADPLRTAS